MKDFSDLFGQRIVIGPVTVAEGHNADTGGKIQIVLAVRIIQIHPFPMIEYHREAIIYMEQHLFRFVHIVLFCHPLCLPVVVSGIFVPKDCRTDTAIGKNLK